MAIENRLVAVTLCDFCGRQESYCARCTGCGKHICYECRDTTAIQCPHSIYATGSGDGLYCHSCDEKLSNDPLRVAYRRIHSLKLESEAYYADFKKRSEAAEAEVKRLYKKSKGE